jgi:insertion element IS1 protein InsB
VNPPYLVETQQSGDLEEIEVEVCLVTEWDEFWSFVGSKAVQRWTWYLMERSSGKVVAYQNGHRQDEVL